MSQHAYSIALHIIREDGREFIAGSQVAFSGGFLRGLVDKNPEAQKKALELVSMLMAKAESESVRVEEVTPHD